MCMGLHQHPSDPDKLTGICPAQPREDAVIPLPLTGQAHLGVQSSSVLLLGVIFLTTLYGVGRAAQQAPPQHSRNMQCWLMLFHGLGRAKKSKEVSTVLETKLHWPPLQLLRRSASVCVCIFPHLLQMFTSRQYYQSEKNKMP